VRQSKYTLERLQPIVSRAFSLGQVLKDLGLKATGGNYRMLHCRLRVLGIDTGHFRGMGWSRGETAQTHASVARTTRRITRTDDEVFVVNSPVICGYRLIRRLRRRGWEYQCLECGIREWRGQPLHLHLDHRNGISNDNRLENLRLLCPNCHSQTSTYCKRKDSLSTAR
jgi:predicted RNA-binding Zn-ribbon protein involved in translation (DUF1610 family)